MLKQGNRQVTQFIKILFSVKYTENPSFVILPRELTLNSNLYPILLYLT